VSHDREHEQLEAKLRTLAKAAGLKWIPCPETDTEHGVDCDNGLVDWGRGPRECAKCDGAGGLWVLVEKKKEPR
jgi:hypothetical protein